MPVELQPSGRSDSQPDGFYVNGYPVDLDGPLEAQDWFNAADRMPLGETKPLHPADRATLIQQIQAGNFPRVVAKELLDLVVESCGIFPEQVPQVIEIAQNNREQRGLEW